MVEKFIKKDAKKNHFADRMEFRKKSNIRMLILLREEKCKIGQKSCEKRRILNYATGPIQEGKARGGTLRALEKRRRERSILKEMKEVSKKILDLQNGKISGQKQIK